MSIQNVTAVIYLIRRQKQCER